MVRNRLLCARLMVVFLASFIAGCASDDIQAPRQDYKGLGLANQTQLAIEELINRHAIESQILWSVCIANVDYYVDYDSYTIGVRYLDTKVSRYQVARFVLNSSQLYGQTNAGEHPGHFVNYGRVPPATSDIVCDIAALIQSSRDTQRMPYPDLNDNVLVMCRGKRRVLSQWRSLRYVGAAYDIDAVVQSKLSDEALGVSYMDRLRDIVDNIAHDELYTAVLKLECLDILYPFK